MTHTKKTSWPSQKQNLQKAVPLLSRDKGKYAIRKPSPLVGEGGGVSRRKGQVGADTAESFLQNSIKYLPVILERSDGK